MSERLAHGSVSAERFRPRSCGDGCLSWKPVDRNDMLLVEDVMPPWTLQEAYRHLLTRQVIFVLSGTLDIDIGGTTMRIMRYEACEVPPGAVHKVLNRKTSDVHFLAFAHPNTKGDRAPPG